MKHLLLRLSPIFAWACFQFPASTVIGQDFLTDKEIEEIQLNQEINLRVKSYVKFAEARLKAAEDRLNGIEPAEGDPFELMTPEDMLRGYYRILRSVMMNLDDAYQHPNPRTGPRLPQALKTLKKSTENALAQLEVLKRIAEEKKKEELWDLVNQAIDVTKGAREGAEFGLSKYPDPARKSPGDLR